MAQQYNALLKYGFQKTDSGAIAELQAAITELQTQAANLQTALNNIKGSKITKVTAAAQLTELTNGEIFEWQAATSEQFTNGYFYQVNNGAYTRVDLQPNYSLPTAAANTLGGVKVGNGLSIDNAGVLSVSGGTNNKVAKCTSTADFANIAADEIFQWQGETTTDFVNGYFYKKTTDSHVIPAGANYMNIPDNAVSTVVDYDGFNVNAGYYTPIGNIDTPTVYGYYRSVDPRNNYITYLTYFPTVVGQKVCKYDTQNNNAFVGFTEVATVQQASGETYNIPATFADGVSVYSPTPMIARTNSFFRKYQNVVDGSIIVCGVFPDTQMNKVNQIFMYLGLDENDVLYPLRANSQGEYLAASEIVISENVFERTNAQTQQLSVVDNQVKYTLSDEQTQINLVSDDTFSGTAVNFPTAAVSGNIISGDTLGTIAKKIFRKERYLSSELPYLHYSDLPSQSTDTETACKEWLQYIVINYWDKVQSGVLYFAPFRPNSSAFIFGFFYATDTPNAQHYPSYCSFILLGISSATLFQKFGTNNYTFYFKALTI